jgi:hypothetical protein
MSSEIRNSRTVHVLLLKDFVNKSVVNGMRDMKYMYIICKELLCFTFC